MVFLQTSCSVFLPESVDIGLCCEERQRSLLDTGVYELDVIPGRYRQSVAVIVEVLF